MAATWDQTGKTATLVRAAQGAGLPFENSPTGRWVRLAGQSGVVYVVQDAWGDGCLVMGADGRTEHFLNAELAVKAAARLAGVGVSGLRRGDRLPLAEAG